MDELNKPVGEINFYCRQIQKKLKNLGLATIRGLLFHFPFRYEDLSQIKKIKELRPNDIATIKATVDSIRNFKSPKTHKKITEVILHDESGIIKAVWFNQWYLKDRNIINPGDEFFLVAKTNSSYELVSPEYEKVSENPTHCGRIVPIYPLTYGVSQKQVRTAIKFALPFIDFLEESLPEEIIAKNNLLGIRDAILNIHFPSSPKATKDTVPTSMEICQRARERLAFDELFLNQLKNFWLKNELKNKKSYPVIFYEKETKDLIAKLPFKLTLCQRKSSWEILQDIMEPYPMNRLLNGDVGSGKTLVAGIAMYNCALSKLQSALLAPTEILAKQHYDTFCELFPNIKIGLVTRGNKITNYELLITNKKQLSQFIAGNSDIIIGTHALIQDNIKFKNLALAVIDEQHRFGVEQRARLSSCQDGDRYPHLLSMTATPIPRTLSLIQYSDLDISLLDELPQGRKTIKTIVVGPEKRFPAYEFIKKQVDEGRQAFVICPLIDESDKLGVKSVTEEYKKLNEKVFPDINIGFLHGKLKSAEKEEVMQDFKNNKIKILVSTSVVEVGVDVPNAVIMMIEGAERFGLAQLHQFRGRVGRGEHQSYCLLFPTDAPTRRLKEMENINDGFRLAEIDLQLRGPGQIYGKEQSGKIEFRLADMNNMFLIKKAQNSAKEILAEDLKLKKHPRLREYLDTELQKIHLE
ncbi:ATP-dependent DNA helicase RecG [Candidatus Parcubacteria bacterium]|nr:ATP-dependent DNA helicase RecG [Candidatus Parcubacteria bacterium]